MIINFHLRSWTKCATYLCFLFEWIATTEAPSCYVKSVFIFFYFRQISFFLAEILCNKLERTLIVCGHLDLFHFYSINYLDVRGFTGWNQEIFKYKNLQCHSKKAYAWLLEIPGNRINITWWTISQRLWKREAACQVLLLYRWLLQNISGSLEHLLFFFAL